MSLHVYHRGINCGPIVGDDHDYEYLLDVIRRAIRRHGVRVHAFAVLTTHFHLVVTPTGEGVLSKAMQEIGIRYTRYFNRKYRRIGTIWNERYGASLLEDERYGYICLRYVDLNPFRAHIVPTPEASPWSSYRVHAFGAPCDWLTPHPLYLRLGPTAALRQEAYRAMCAIPLTDEELERQRHPPRRAVVQLPVGV
jgi:putative transposase